MCMGEKASVPALQLSFTNWLEGEGRSSASAFHFAEQVCKSGANADIFKVVEQRLGPATGGLPSVLFCPCSSQALF